MIASSFEAVQYIHVFDDRWMARENEVDFVLYGTVWASPCPSALWRLPKESVHYGKLVGLAKFDELSASFIATTETKFSKDRLAALSNTDFGVEVTHYNRTCSFLSVK